MQRKLSIFLRTIATRATTIVHVIGVNADAHGPIFHIAAGSRSKHLGQRPGASRALATVHRLFELRRRLHDIKPDLVVSFLTKINVLVGLATIGLDTTTIMSERNNFKLQNMNLFWRLVAPIRRARAAAWSCRPTLPAVPFPSISGKGRRHSEPCGAARQSRSDPRASGQGSSRSAAWRSRRASISCSKHFPVSPSQLPDGHACHLWRGPGARIARAAGARTRDCAIASECRASQMSPGDWLSAGDVFVLEFAVRRISECPAGGVDGRDGHDRIRLSVGAGRDTATTEDAGLLVPAADVDKLAEALRRVATDQPLRQKLAASGPCRDALFQAGRLRAMGRIIAKAVDGRAVNLPRP